MSRPSPDPIIILTGHTGTVTAVCFTNEMSHVLPSESTASSPLSLWLLSGSDKGEIFIWSLETYRTEYKLPLIHDDKQILWLELWNDYILSQGRDGFLRLSNCKQASGQWKEQRTIKIALLSFCCCSIIKEADLIAAPGENDGSEALVINLKNGKVISSLVPKTDTSKKYGMCMCLKLIPDCLLCGYESGEVLLWNWSEKVILSSIICYKEPVLSLDFDLSKQQGICCSVTNVICTWRMTTDNEIKPLKNVTTTNPGNTMLNVRHDSRIVAAGGSDGRIRIFSWKTMKALAVLSWHRDGIHSVQFSKNHHLKYGLLLAAGSKDGKITLWSLYN